MRILLVHPQNYLHSRETGIYRGVAGYAPLTMATLAALVPPELGAAVRIVNEMVERVDTTAAADLVGITAIAGTAPRAYGIADAFRERGTTVVLGGIHPTLMPEEASAHADCVVSGLAEQTWPRLLRDFAAGRLASSYRQEEDYTFSGFPPPRRDLMRTTPAMIGETFELTRGCVRNCEFCIFQGFLNGRYYRKPVPEAIEEIRRLRSRFLLFLDANIVGDREYAKEFFSRLAPLGKLWTACATSDVADDDGLLDVLARSGCRGLLVGFESLCQDTLARIGKGFNRAAGNRALVRKLHDRGIAVHGCFVLGFDGDTPRTFQETFAFVQEARVDFPQYTIYTPFPGTPVHRRMRAEGRILTDDWSLYNGQNCVFRPSGMTAGELEQGTRALQRASYGLLPAARRLGELPLWMRPVLLRVNLAYGAYARRIPAARERRARGLGARPCTFPSATRRMASRARGRKEKSA